jgi:hypothetical protein
MLHLHFTFHVDDVAVVVVSWQKNMFSSLEDLICDLHYKDLKHEPTIHRP